VTVDEIKRVAVIGGGQMGHGIAQVFALAGYEVNLNSRTEESLQKAVKDIQDDLQRLIEFGLATQEQVDSVLPKIHTSTVLRDSVADADVVIEAVYEDLELKQRIFQELDDLCPEHTILASSTSTIVPSKLAPATRRPDKVLVAHFTGPAYLSPLVEVVKSEATSDDTAITIYDLLTKVGKRPAMLQKEAIGFIANRLQAALVREALPIVQKGIASPQDVDTVIKNGGARRWVASGIFEMLELIPGWDFLLNSEDAFGELLADLDSSTVFPAFVREKVDRNELGAKTGKGFCDWTPEAIEAARSRMARAFAEIEKWSREADAELPVPLPPA